MFFQWSSFINQAIKSMQVHVRQCGEVLLRDFDSFLNSESA